MNVPKAYLLSDSPSQAVWRIKWPSTPRKAGKEYFARTYPNSEIIRIETGATRKPISAARGRIIGPQIRAAIETARAKGWAAS